MSMNMIDRRFLVLILLYFEVFRFDVWNNFSEHRKEFRN